MAAISHLSHLLPIDRPDSRVSLALSDTTYHSFQDMELYEPGALAKPHQTQAVCLRVSTSPVEEDMPITIPREMRRQDSGYESMIRRDSYSSSSCRRTSSISISPSTPQRRARPPARRASRSNPVPHLRRDGRHSTSPPGTSRSLPPQPQQAATYFHFPNFTSSDPALGGDADVAVDPHSVRDFAAGRPSADAPTYAQPPQTTHYWTSDRTRRLEYAAIDAASKGVRGWVMRHVVPDCFVPPSKRRVGFEDDRGSVVRYRLELDAEESAEKAESVRARRWRGWWFSMRRH
ncbi:hypothetical protein BT67DRAFT_42295 [Trichocladium antarcticum]|uniref:Uncharacterized protein n=1 Tax=Trichocladium antarcticum TaxID=1450529 RepID=A0AAN6UL69_9PEZI|nr:hypothetical protein BT67DRAFT_42295 [Trichocladium antarcticum]